MLWVGIIKNVHHVSNRRSKIHYQGQLIWWLPGMQQGEKEKEVMKEHSHYDAAKGLQGLCSQKEKWLHLLLLLHTPKKKEKKKAKKDKEKADDIQKHIFSHLEGKHLQWNYKTLMLNEKETNK